MCDCLKCNYQIESIKSEESSEEMYNTVCSQWIAFDMYRHLKDKQILGISMEVQKSKAT